MAQTIDLPEPTQAPAANASADDLLSQLAGAEIDKLLAEAEIEKPSAVAATPAPEADLAELQTLTDVAAAAPEPAPANLPPEPAAAVPPEATQTKQEQAEAAVSAELDELFKELSSDATIASPPPVPVPAAPASKPAASAPAQVAAAPVAPAPAPVKLPATEQPTSTQERAALDAALKETEHEAADESDEPASLPIYLKPLEWLNLPLSFVPEPARDLVGKVAIVSFMNAVSVMVYLLVFHRR